MGYSDSAGVGRKVGGVVAGIGRLRPALTDGAASQYSPHRRGFGFWEQAKPLAWNAAV